MADDDSKRVLLDELDRVIRRHAPKMSVDALADALSQVSSKWLASGSAPPSANGSKAPSPTVTIGHVGGDEYAVQWHFYSGDDLREVLGDILDTQAVMLQLTPMPPMMATLRLAICSDHHPDITLDGRVVHQAGERSAVQIFQPPPLMVGALRTLPDVLDEHSVAPSVPEAPFETPVVPPHVAERIFGPSHDKPVERATMPAAARPRDEAHPFPFEGRPGTGAFVHVVKEESRRLELDELELEDALIELALDRPTGVLELELDGEIAMQVVLDRGSIVDLRRMPEREEDSVELLLNKARKISTEQVLEARDRATLYGCTVADALIDLGFLDFSDVRVALKTRLIYLLRHLWIGEFDAVTLQRFNRLPRRYLAPPVSLIEQIFSRIFSRLCSSRSDELEAVRQHFSGLFVARRDPCPVTADQLGLDAKQSRFFLQGLVSHRSIGEILLISGMGHSETIAMIAALDRMGVIDSKELDVESEARNRYDEQLDVFLAKIGTGTHFEILGVHWSTYDEELAEVYEDLMLRYADESFLGARKDTLDKLSRVRAAVRASYDALRRRADRRRYRLSVVDSYKVESSLEMYLRQADAAKLRRDVAAAIDFYRRVLEINPHHKKATRDVELLLEYQAAERASQKS